MFVTGKYDPSVPILLLSYLYLYLYLEVQVIDNFHSIDGNYTVCVYRTHKYENIIHEMKGSYRQFYFRFYKNVVQLNLNDSPQYKTEKIYLFKSS